MRGSEVEPFRMGNRVGRDEMLNGTQVDNSEAVSASEPEKNSIYVANLKLRTRPSRP